MTRQDIIEALVEAGYSRDKIRVLKNEVRVEEDLRCERDWPLLWSVIEDLDLKWGGGGTNYIQIDARKLEE